MAELHIDDDWKKQAQEEKRRLAEQQKQAPAAPAPAAPSAGAGPAQAAGPSRVQDPRARGARELPTPSFATLVQAITTQVLYYLGELGGGEAAINLDMAKHQIDTLNILEDKTRNNLTPEEQTMLDGALYETRMRYVSVASQFT